MRREQDEENERDKTTELDMRNAAHNSNTNSNKSKKTSKKKSIKSGEFIPMNKLKLYLDGLHKCYLMNKSALQAKYGSTNNPLINYVFSVFDEQIFLAVEPFQKVVMQGDSSMFMMSSLL